MAKVIRLQQRLEERALEIRMREWDLRDDLIDVMREIQIKKRWQELGYSSLEQFCKKYLNCDKSAIREIVSSVGGLSDISN